jgi:proteasome lid subunit RPN8/RPN11
MRPLLGPGFETGNRPYGRTRGCGRANREHLLRSRRKIGKAAIRQAKGQMIEDGKKGQTRIDVDEALPSVAIPRRILNDLYAHAIQSLPEECCGLIVGTEKDRFQRLVRCRNEMTMRHRQDPVEYPRDGSEAFYMNSLDYMIVDEEAEARGARITAVYHSHVGVGAYLSGMDLDYAESANFPFPDADHIVVAIFDRKVDSVAFFRKGGEGQPFLGRTVVSSDT